MLRYQPWFEKVILKHLNTLNKSSVAMVKDLLVENIDGHVIHFCDESARIAKPDEKVKHRPVVGMPVLSVKIGDHCYHGLCDLGASVSAIPFTLYQKL